MRKVFAFIAALVAIAVLAPVTPANAGSTYSGYKWSQASRDSGICVENKLSGLKYSDGSSYDSGGLWAVLRWRENNAQFLYYRDDNGCDTKPWHEKVIVNYYANYNDNRCGFTDFEAFPLTNTISKASIYINLTSEFNNCWGTRQRRYHVFTHELGHGGVGLGDISNSSEAGWGNSIMDYSTDLRTTPTALDAWRADYWNS